jgi:hypothetical protein
MTLLMLRSIIESVRVSLYCGVWERHPEQNPYVDTTQGFQEKTFNSVSRHRAKNTLPEASAAAVGWNTKGTAFVVYDDVMDAKTACDNLNGFNFQNRYLVGKCLLEESSVT